MSCGLDYRTFRSAYIINQCPALSASCMAVHSKEMAGSGAADQSTDSSLVHTTQYLLDNGRQISQIRWIITWIPLSQLELLQMIGRHFYFPLVHRESGVYLVPWNKCEYFDTRPGNVERDVSFSWGGTFLSFVYLEMQFLTITLHSWLSLPETVVFSQVLPILDMVHQTWRSSGPELQ